MATALTWATSDRRSRLPRNWPAIRTRVLKRDPVCRCRGCPRCTPDGCPVPSAEADHILPIDDHAMTNLQGLCKPCHTSKTIAQRPVMHRRRPSEPHPGMTPGG